MNPSASDWIAKLLADYEKDKLTTLDDSFLRTLKTKAGEYIIYADNCLLDEKLIEKYHIIFKKIPRDISRF